MPFRKPRVRDELPPAGTPINFTDPVARGMILCWLLNEGAGSSTVFDSSGYGYNGTNVAYGTLIPPIWSPSPLGTTADFSNASSGNPCIMQGPAVPTNFTSSDFSIAVRCNYVTILNSPVIFYHGSFNISGYYSQISSSGQINISTNQSPHVTNNTGTGMVVAGVWQHLVYVRQGTVMKIYVNGIDQTTTSNSVVNPADASSVPLWLGGYNGSDGLYSRAKLSDFRVWNRALLASEVKGLYETPSRPFINPRRRIISASGVTETITSDKWAQPISQPMNRRTEMIPY